MILIVGLIIGSGLVIATLVSIKVAEGKNARTDLRVDLIRSTCDRAISGSVRRFSRVASHAICSFVVHVYKMLKVFVNIIFAWTSHLAVVFWKAGRRLVSPSRLQTKAVGKTAPTRYTVS